MHRANQMGKTGFDCIGCGKVFAYKQHLQNHLKARLFKKYTQGTLKSEDCIGHRPCDLQLARRVCVADITRPGRAKKRRMDGKIVVLKKPVGTKVFWAPQNFKTQCRKIHLKASKHKQIRTPCF